MTDTSAPMRVEPNLDPRVPPTATMAAAELRAAVEAAPSGYHEPAYDSSRGGIDQLSRIEDKTARIEEKYARSEALLLRVGEKVEAATSRMADVALQADLTALSQRVRGLPGMGALILTAIITAVLTAAAVYAILKYGVPGVPGVTPR